MVSLLWLTILLMMGYAGRPAKAYNDFPSLMTANATMAVIIEKGFFKDVQDYKRTATQISNTISNMTKRYMKISGIVVNIFEDINLNLARDYTILLSVATCQTTWNLLKPAEKEEIIFLAITNSDCPRLPDYAGISLPLLDPGEELPQIFLDLRMSGALAWPKVNFIYDDTFARDTISRVLRALSIELPDRKLSLSARSLFSAKFERDVDAMRRCVRRILSDFHAAELGSCFMVIVTVDMVPLVMEIAKSLKMTNPSSQWLYIINEGSARGTQGQAKITSFNHLLAEGENVAFVYNATRRIGRECNMGLMCHVREIAGALAVSFENSLMAEMELYDHVTEEEFEVIRLSKAERKKEIIKSVKREMSYAALSKSGCGECISWRISSAVTWGASFIRNETVNRTRQSANDRGITEAPPDDGQFVETGRWSPGPGVNMTEPLFLHISHGFRGLRLPVSSYHNPPWQIIKDSSKGKKEYGGLIFDILNYLSVKLNFTYTVKSPSSYAASKISLNRDSSVKQKSSDAVAAMSVSRSVPPGILELVRAGKTFIGAAAITVVDNAPGINFTTSVASQTYALLSAKPRLLSRALLFMAPYTAETWACLTSTLILIGPILYLIVKLSPRPVDVQDVFGLTTTWQCSWYVYGALLQQGGMNLPKADSARLVVGTWWIVVMVVVATYSGNLIAFLTFPRLGEPIDSVDDLLERSPEYTWAFPNGSALATYLSAAADQEAKYKQLLEGAQRQDPERPAQALDRVKTENFVLIDWRTSLAFLMSMDLIDTGSCHFHVGAENFMYESMAMIVARDSPYLRLINDAIKRMHESGLIKKWTTDKMPMKNKCYEALKINQEATTHKVNMGDMQGIFFVLAIGFIIASIAIGSEFVWNKRKRAAEKKFVRPFVT